MHLLKVGKNVYLVGDDGARRKLRDVKPEEIEPLLIGLGPFGPMGEFMGYHASTHIVYALEDSDDREQVIEYIKAEMTAIYPLRRAMGGPGTIEMFWRNSHNRPLLKLLVGAVQYYAHDGKLVITHMSVRPKWRRHGLNSLMVDNIASSHPGSEVIYDDPTEMGKRFMRGRGIQVNPSIEID